MNVNQISFSYLCLYIVLSTIKFLVESSIGGFGPSSYCAKNMMPIHTDCNGTSEKERERMKERQKDVTNVEQLEIWRRKPWLGVAYIRCLPSKETRRKKVRSESIFWKRVLMQNSSYKREMCLFKEISVSSYFSWNLNWIINISEYMLQMYTFYCHFPIQNHTLYKGMKAGAEGWAKASGRAKEIVRMNVMGRELKLMLWMRHRFNL